VLELPKKRVKKKTLREEHMEDHIGECGAMMVQLMSVPLPLICTGREDNKGQNIGNSHNLAATLFSRLLDQRKQSIKENILMCSDKSIDWVQIALYGPHYRLLLEGMMKIRHLRNVLDINLVIGAGYPLLQVSFFFSETFSMKFNKTQFVCCVVAQAYMRSVLDIMVNVDLQYPRGNSELQYVFENDIRFEQDLGRICSKTAGGLKDNAARHLNAMIILQDGNVDIGVSMENVDVAKLDYRDFVAMNIYLLMDIAKAVLGREKVGEEEIPSYDVIKQHLHAQLDARIISLDDSCTQSFTTVPYVEIGEISDNKDNDAWTIKISFHQINSHAGKKHHTQTMHSYHTHTHTHTHSLYKKQMEDLPSGSKESTSTHV
jgi:hypothetical protein